MECYRQSNIYWHDSPTNSAGFPLVLTQPGEDTAPEGYDAFLKSMEEDLENDCVSVCVVNEISCYKIILFLLSVSVSQRKTCQRLVPDP